MLRTIVTWATVFAVVINGNVATAATSTTVHSSSGNPSDPEFIYDQAMEGVEELMHTVREMRSHIDRSQFDLEALIEKLDFDAEMIVEFVCHQIAFEQYPGLLRGDRGTLMSRAGNALDQSILLAKLLNDAGYDARIARTTLSRDHVRELLLGLADPRPLSPSVGDVQNLNELLQKYVNGDAEIESALTDVPASDARAEIVRRSSAWKESRRSGETLVNVLRESALFSRNDASRDNKLEDEASDYFWVQYRSGPAEDWVNVHPTADVDWQDLKVEQVLVGSVPPELQHRIKFQAFVTQNLGAKMNVHPIMAAQVWPAANLVGKPQIFSILPMPLDPSWNWDEVKKGVPNAKMFFPTLNGSVAGDVAFDINGFVVPVMAAASPYAALFQTVSGKLSEATGLLGGLGTKQVDAVQPAAALDEVYVEITYLAPDGSEVVHKRQVLAGGARMTAPVRAMSLFTDAAILTAVGSYPESFLLDLQLQDVLEMEPKLRDLVAEELGVKRQGDLAYSGFTAGYFELYGLFDSGAEAPSYRDSPSIVVFRRGMDPVGRYVAHMDIVANGRRTLDGSGTEPGLSLFGSVYSGVWETQAESAIFNGVPAVSSGAMARLRSLDDRKARFTVIGDKVDDVAELATLPESIKAAMERELEQGYVLVSPTADAVEDGEWAWWRIDPNNGSALGVLPDGTGASETSDYTLLLTITLGVGNFIADGLGRLACEDPTGQNSEYVCKSCTEAGIITGGAGAFTGGLSWVAAQTVKEVVEDAVEAGIKVTLSEALKRISVAAAILGLLAKIVCAAIAVGGRILD